MLVSQSTAGAIIITKVEFHPLYTDRLSHLL